jgi:hypothetical protein
LAAAGFIVVNDLKRGAITRTALSLPQELEARCKRLRSAESAFFSHIMNALLEFPLYGENGIKARSGLLEYRYDNI